MAFRTVVEGVWFADSRRALGLSPWRLDEILEGAILILCSQPTRYPIVEGTILRTLTTLEIPPEIPAYTIFFSFSGDQVTLEWIEHTEPRTAPGGRPD